MSGGCRPMAACPRCLSVCEYPGCRHCRRRRGAPHPPAFCKTTSGRFSSRISSLAGPPTRPVLRAKSKGGAPRGNRNAQKSGCHTAAFREFKRALAHYVRALKAELAARRAALPRQRKRIFYEVVTPERCYVRTRRGSPCAKAAQTGGIE